MRTCWIWTIGAVSCVVWPCVATAQETLDATDTGAPEPVLDHRPLTLSVEFFGEHAFKRDLNDGGDVSTTREGVILSYADRIDELSAISLSLKVQGVHHDFSGAPRLFAGADNGESDLYVIRFVPVYSRQIDEEWSWLLGGAMQLTGGRDTLGNDAFSGAVFVAGRKKYSETFSLALGLTVVTLLEDDPILAPFIGIEWQINDRLRLTSDAFSLELRAELEDDLAFRVNAGFDIEEFRYDDDTPIPEGVLQETWVDVGVGIDWTPDPQWLLQADVGVRIIDRFKTQDSSGDDVSTDNADPTIYIGGSVTFRF